MLSKMAFMLESDCGDVRPVCVLSQWVVLHMRRTLLVDVLFVSKVFRNAA